MQVLSWGLPWLPFYSAQDSGPKNGATRMGLPSSVKPFEKSLRDMHRSVSPKRFQIQSAGHEDEPSPHLHVLSSCRIQDRGCPRV